MPKNSMKTANQIHKRFDALPEQEQTAFLLKLIDQKPIEDLSLVELFEQTIAFRESNHDAILDFADRFRKAHPTIYDQEYEFLELKLTEYAFDTKDKQLIDRCLDVIARDPVRGIETVTRVTLYRLVYHGMVEEALAYSQTVWEPIANDDDLWGYPELPFIMTIFMDGVEKQYEKLSQGDTAGWNDFMKGMTRYGFEHEKKRADAIYHALTTDPDAEQLVRDARKDAEYGFIPLMYHFLRYMKETYHMPFMHAFLFMDLLQNKKMLGHSKHSGAFLYLPHKVLDKYVTEKLDTFLGSNRLELFGKVWGLHYVYEFLFDYGMIDQKHYDKMLVTLATIKKDFLAVLGTSAWQAKFVLSWPESKANTLKPDPAWFEKTGAGRELSMGEFVRMITGMDDPRDDDDLYFDGKIPIEADEYEVFDDDEDWVEEELGENEIWDDDDGREEEEDWQKNAGTLISGNDPYIAEKKPGRNEPCPCGSGKKYKKCCHKTK